MAKKTPIQQRPLRREPPKRTYGLRSGTLRVPLGNLPLMERTLEALTRELREVVMPLVGVPIKFSGTTASGEVYVAHHANAPIGLRFFSSAGGIGCDYEIGIGLIGVEAKVPFAQNNPFVKDLPLDENGCLPEDFKLVDHRCADPNCIECQKPEAEPPPVASPAPEPLRPRTAYESWPMTTPEVDHLREVERAARHVWGTAGTERHDAALKVLGDVLADFDRFRRGGS